MDPRLQLAIENDDVDELHRLLGKEQKILDRGSEEPLPNAPLHDAAAAGKTQVAMEMAILKRSFVWKLNSEGYSPMHLALQHGCYRTARALMTLNPELIRVQGRYGITPLHYVAGREGDNELELLAEFLSTCRLSIEDLTSRCETTVHVAVKNHNVEAFKVLFGWLKRANMTKILGWKDQDGNNALHIAAFENQAKIIKLLIGWASVNAKNFQGKTALEIFEVNLGGDQDVMKKLCRQGRRERRFTPTLSLSRFYRTELTIFEKYAGFFGTRGKSAQKIILVVSTLIATATYQAALTPPGGYWLDSSSNPSANSTVVAARSGGTVIGNPHRAGNMILKGWKPYLFTILNSTAFFTSIGTIWATAITLLPQPLIIYFSITVLSLAYFISLMVEFPKPNEVTGILLGVFYECSLFSVLLLPWYVRGTYIRVLHRIDATRRCVAGFLVSKDWK